MRLSIIAAALTYATAASAAISWSLEKAASPTADQQDAYQRIEAAMRLAVARYARFTNAAKTVRVYYTPGVPTAEANYNGDLRFGSDRAYMTERTAMHEIAHTLGVGQTANFDRNCAANSWPKATPLLQSWDGASARINCGGGHFWPYGLNYETEWSETNGNRHVQLVDAMLADGM
ncbi:putative ricin B lectin [Rosellinia necatrix]|uniref:Putative ricin B lectin n=1 Tax=Rosellinia necatrix TaxID=77044 RepID=A0A1S7UU24_ROSNE|nr:putative ricin B lectin [Rosellinia necatrix]